MRNSQLTKTALTTSVGLKSPTRVPSIPTQATHLLKSSAMPKLIHPNPPRMHSLRPSNRMSKNATLAENPVIYQTRVLNKSFIALWQSSFADAAQQQCATRCLKSWGDDVCPTCLGELSFDHQCDPSDIAIAQHASSVRDILRSTPLLQTIQSAYAFKRADTEKPAQYR